jgi:hypothetical protein
VLELFVPRRLREEGLRLLRELEAAGAPARLYVVPDDFAYRLQLAVQYDPGAARPYLERGILAAPAAAWGGRAVAVGRLPSAAELLALTGSPAPPPETRQLPAPPVEVSELEVEPSPSPAAPGGEPREPRAFGLTEEGRRFLEEVLRRSGELLSAPPPPPPAEAAGAQPETQQLPGRGGGEEGVVVVEDAVKLAAAREAAEGEGTAPSRSRRKKKKRGV